MAHVTETLRRVSNIRKFPKIILRSFVVFLEFYSQTPRYVPFISFRLRPGSDAVSATHVTRAEGVGNMIVNGQ